MFKIFEYSKLKWGLYFLNLWNAILRWLIFMNDHFWSLDFFWIWIKYIQSINKISMIFVLTIGLFHKWFWPSSEWNEIIEWVYAIMMKITEFGLFCNLRTTWLASNDQLPHFFGCVDSNLFPIGLYSFHDVLDILTVIDNMEAIPRATISRVGDHFYPYSSIKILRNFLHHFINLRVDSFATARKHVNICIHIEESSVF